MTEIATGLQPIIDDNGDFAGFKRNDTGAENLVPRYVDTASGGAVITSRDGVPFDRFPLPSNPNGLSWLTDTISGFDIYEKGFVKRPTIFVDWNASSSLGLGTFNNPYTTPAQVLARTLNQDMAGQVLGIKRGSILRDETSALGASTLLTVKGYSSDVDRPFIICPYGDAEALPIITGERRTGTGSLYPWTNNGGGIWYISVDYCCHVWDFTRTNGQKRSPMVASLGAVTVPGQSYYDAAADRLYFMPWYGEDPNGSGYLINYAFIGMAMTPAKVAAAGNIQVSGLEVRMGRNNCLTCNIEAADYATITSLPNWNFYGNKIFASGRDKSSYTLNSSNAAFSWYGGWTGAAHVPYSGTVAGNEFCEALNNGFEITGSDGLIVEYNYGHDNGGTSIIELYGSCANAQVRYNVGMRSADRYVLSDGTDMDFLASGFADMGVWVGPYKINGAGTAATTSAGALDTGIDNNNIHHNLIIDSAVGCKVSAGSGHKFQHNTFVNNNTDPRITTSVSMFQAYSTVAAHTNVSNNIGYLALGLSKALTLECIYSTSDAAIPTGDGNVYRGNASGYIKFKVNATNYTTFAAWKAYAGAIAANMDQTLSVNPSTVQLAWDSTYHRPGAGSTVIAGGVANLGLGTRYRLGNVRSDAAPTAGSEGAAL